MRFMTEKINYSAEEVLNGKINKILDNHSRGIAGVSGFVEGLSVGAVGVLKDWNTALGIVIGLVVAHAVEIGISAHNLSKQRKGQEEV
jgi:hypothetical protein